ncbi:MAG TPA: LytS/YhcK type 5TM receptor domain-containing protein, partial [Oscillatoriaceae cyanobacterium]
MGGLLRRYSRVWVLLALLPLALVWELSPLARLPVFGWRLDPTLVLAMAAGLLFGPGPGALYGMIAGAGQDMLLGAGLLYTVTKAIAGLAAGIIKPQIYQLDLLSTVLMGLVWTAAEGLEVAIYLLMQGRTEVWDHYAALALPLGLA